MLIKEKKFFKPSKKTRELSILENLNMDSTISQSELGQKIDLSGAMVNSYLKHFKNDGLLTLKPVNGRCYVYELTGKGEELRKEWLGEYSAEIVQIYSALKSMVREKLKDLIDSGIKRIVLFGASETCEVVLSALQKSELKILAIIDNDSEKQGNFMQKMVISPPDILGSLEFEAVVITTFVHQQAIHNQLAPLVDKKKIKIVGL